jgi:hypothetical protein
MTSVERYCRGFSRKANVARARRVDNQRLVVQTAKPIIADRKPPVPASPSSSSVRSSYGSAMNSVLESAPRLHAAIQQAALTDRDLTRIKLSGSYNMGETIDTYPAQKIRG